MTAPRADVVICGAGIAGVATAYHLAVRRGITDVVLVDERPPLSLTSDKSAECYRNWWPGPGDDMVALMNRSIDLLEELARESANVFRMNRRGYLFASAETGRIPVFVRAAEEAAELGAGPARIHATDAGGYEPALDELQHARVHVRRLPLEHLRPRHRESPPHANRRGLANDVPTIREQPRGARQRHLGIAGRSPGALTPALTRVSFRGSFRGSG